MGLFYEDFQVGASVVTRGRTVGEGDISTFAGLVGDHNPLHVDEEFCRGTGFGQRIAHGPLTMSVAIGLMSQQNLIDGTVIALLGLEWSFHAPVRIGDTIHAVVTTAEKRDTGRPDRGVVRLGFEVMRQDGVRAQRGVAALLMRRRGDAAPA